MTIRKHRPLIGLVGALALMPAAAKDVDLFEGDSASSADAPNVLLMIDNTANWTSSNTDPTKKRMIHESLHKVVSDDEWWVPDDSDSVNIRLGLMSFSSNGSGAGKGGAVREHVQDLDASFRDEFQCLLYDTASSTSGDGCKIQDNKEALEKSSSAAYALSFAELFNYFRGRDLRAASQDETDNDAHDGSSYISPHDSAGTCAEDFAIFFGNGAPDSGEDKEAEELLDTLEQLSGTADARETHFTITPDQFESNWADEYTAWLAGSDLFTGTEDKQEQNLTTYVIDVVKESDSGGSGGGNNNNSGGGGGKKRESASALLKSIAERGDGRYFKASNAEEIQTALDKALNEIRAVNDVFASTTLPVSVNVRGTNLNQVYMGVFRPDDDGKPRWQGNLKLYELALDSSTGELFLADSDGNKAESSATGFIVDGATSYWTHPQVEGSDYWSFKPRGEINPSKDDPDGPQVEKGGAHQRLRDQHDGSTDGDHTWRNLYTCTGTCNNSDFGNTPTDLTNFAFDTDNSNVTDDFNDPDGDGSLTANDVINWVRGADVNDADDDGSTSDARPSIHGDVLHSKPAVINYSGPDEDPDIYAFYGANDGIFHAVKGGKTNGSDGDGNELWGFIPPEFFDADFSDGFTESADNDLEELFDNVETDFGERPNFVDGTVTVLKNDPDNDGINASDDPNDEVIIYLSMRRGGRFLYAIDVTDPESPELLWHIDSDDTGFGELGQTWSKPTVATVRDGSNGDTLNEAVIFGGGYDPNDDTNTPSTNDSVVNHTQGRAVYVVDAHNGKMIWRAQSDDSSASAPSNGDSVSVTNMDHAVAGNVAATNVASDSGDSDSVDRLYFGDLGGQVWRVDTNGAPKNWSIFRLANLPGGSDRKDDRKFLFEPDVVAAGDFDAVMLGSGDRSHPNEADQKPITNEFYMLKDTNNSASILSADNAPDAITQGDLANVTDGLDTNDDGTNEVDVSSSDGWRFTLGNKEMVVGKSITLAGTVFFNTLDLAPSGSDDCQANLGIARSYKVDFRDATAPDGRDSRFEAVPGGGFQPSPTPVVVEVDDGDGGKVTKLGVISGTQVFNAPNVDLEQPIRSYWYDQAE